MSKESPGTIPTCRIDHVLDIFEHEYEFLCDRDRCETYFSIVYGMFALRALMSQTGSTYTLRASPS